MHPDDCENCAGDEPRTYWAKGGGGGGVVRIHAGKVDISTGNDECRCDINGDGGCDDCDPPEFDAHAAIGKFMETTIDHADLMAEAVEEITWRLDRIEKVLTPPTSVAAVHAVEESVELQWYRAKSEKDRTTIQQQAEAISKLVRQRAELLPWAAQGAQAISDGVYSMVFPDASLDTLTGSVDGDTKAADAILDRIDAGEFGTVPS